MQDERPFRKVPTPTARELAERVRVWGIEPVDVRDLLRDAGLLATRVEKVLVLVKRLKNEGPYGIVSCDSIERILNGKEE